MFFRVFSVSPLEPCGLGNELGYAFCAGTLGVLMRRIFQLSRVDVRPLPAEGPVILAPNHRSFIDPLVVGSAVDRRSYYIMSRKYYDIRAINWFFRMSRCVVVEEDAENLTALRDAKKVLDQGKVLTIFPEGHISPDGNLQAGQQGVAWLARRTGALVVPVWVGGTREVLTKGAKRLHHSKIRMRTGDPLSIADYPPGREGIELFTEAVMAAIAKLGAASTR
jgi:1-acyl-sn-glycerol-3-phosphate acyltransferase